MIITDLQKAFDTINHEILLGKLHAIGFLEKTIARFKAYLSDQTRHLKLTEITFSQIYIKFLVAFVQDLF